MTVCMTSHSFLRHIYIQQLQKVYYMVITYSDVCQDNVRKTWFGLGSSLYPHQFRFLFSVHHFALVSMPFSLSVGISYFRILILFARNSQSLLMQLLKGHFKYSLYKLISTESLLPLLTCVLQNACCLC